MRRSRRDLKDARATSQIIVGHIARSGDPPGTSESSGSASALSNRNAKAEEIIGDDRSGILFVAAHAFDCIGAKSFGMRTAFIDRRRRPFGQTPHQPDLVVANFSELAAALT